MDRAAFQRFYEATSASLRGYLRLRCGDAALADDVLQEAYLRMLRRPLPELDAARRKAYLYRTALSALADYFRARKREKPSPTESGITVGLEATDAAADELIDGPSGGDLDLPIDMQRVFGTLTPRQQSLLWLAYVAGFSHDEIAELTGVGTGSVRVLLSRARAALAARLGKHGMAPATAPGAGK